MTRIASLWAELAELQCYVEAYPLEAERDDIAERMVVLEDAIADTPCADLDDVVIKLRVLLGTLQAGPQTLEARLIRTAAQALRPTGLH